MTGRPARPCIERGCPERAVPGGARCAAHAVAWREQRWQEGATGHRGMRPGWAKIRRRVLDRDRRRCRFCGSTTRLEVAHISGDAKDDRMSNLLTMCQDHHFDWDRRPRVNDDKQLPGQMTIEECIKVATEEDVHRLAKYPRASLPELLAERARRQANVGQEEDRGDQDPGAREEDR